MDTNQINFNELWSKQESTPPDIKELSKKIHSFKRKNILRIILTNVVLAGTIAFIIFVWMHYQPQLLTTKIGIILTVLAMVIYIIVTNNTISLFKKTTKNLWRNTTNSVKRANNWPKRFWRKTATPSWSGITGLKKRK